MDGDQIPAFEQLVDATLALMFSINELRIENRGLTEIRDGGLTLNLEGLNHEIIKNEARIVELREQFEANRVEILHRYGTNTIYDDNNVAAPMRFRMHIGTVIENPDSRYSYIRGKMLWLRFRPQTLAGAAGNWVGMTWNQAEQLWVVQYNFIQLNVL